MTAFLAAMTFCSADCPAQEFKNANFSKGMEEWKVAFPTDLEAKAEVVADAFEGKPALKIEVPEAEVESWRGKVSHAVSLPSAGNYTLVFYARVEPTDAYIEVSVWGSIPDKPKNIGPRKNFEALPEWQEFLYNFSVDAPDPAASITWGNLAKGGKTFFLGGIRLTKDE